MTKPRECPGTRSRRPRRTTPVAARVGHGAQAQRVTMGRGWLQLSQDDVDAARSSLEGAVAMAPLGGSIRITLWALGWLARVQFLTGEWDRALHSVEQGHALAASSAIVLATPLLEWTAAQVHALRGSWEEAAAAVRAADVVTQDYEMMQIPTLLARAQVAEAKADYAKVRRVLDPLTRMSLHASFALREPGCWPWTDVQANALVIEGQLAAAEEFLRPHEDLARDRGHCSTMARLGYARGRLLGAMGHLPAARRAFGGVARAARRAAAALRPRAGQLRLRPDAAPGGQAARGRRGHQHRARSLSISPPSVLTPMCSGASASSRPAEPPSCRAARAGTSSSPLQEEAVTLLVAQGLSNREVAAELYVSPKTVQYHLTRIGAKLGVRSRAELGAARR